MPRSLPIAVLALLLALPVHARAETQAAQGLPPQAFSADLVRIDAAGEPRETAGRLYASGTGIRIETPDFPGNYFLVDLEARASYYVQPAQRMIMEARLSSPLALVFLPVDPDNPCPQWQAQAALAGAPGPAVGRAAFRRKGPRQPVGADHVRAPVAVGRKPRHRRHPAQVVGMDEHGRRENLRRGARQSRQGTLVVELPRLIHLHVGDGRSKS